MNKEEFSKALKNTLFAKLNITFKIKTVKPEQIVLLKISTPNYSQVVDWYVDGNGNIPDAEDRLSDIITTVSDLLYQSEYSKLKREIREIAAACAYYAQNCKIGITHPNDYSGKCTKEELAIIGCQLFILRAHEHFKTLSTLSDTHSHEDFYRFEFSINVILRSCILDSLLMSAWVKDKSRVSKFIRDLIVSSYLMTPSGLSAVRDKEIMNGANYFNVGCKKDINNNRKKKILNHVSTNGFIEYLKGSNHIKSFRGLYDMYSKFDHFSPIPYLHFLERPVIEKISIHRDSFHFVKHALSQMLIKRRDPLMNTFCDILGLP
ncbi:hypothetical protein [Dyadobacter arcticus]|uniref:Uncharacterized protein n=1 Tax=Dyadobacter arcticus TaxID=1078754 RepID=A0ABX0UR29_9BACT|nr:hypothetical protein [Dyadobacter arcticus]NIJ55426.1 hypothetical protein [Dyadobacter arcticus]